MKKVTKIILVVMIVSILALSLIACDEPAHGKSAYDIAVDNGFVGSEQEWLDSLVGKDGKDGINGQNGAIGQKGDDGKTITPENLVQMYNDAFEKGYTGTYVDFLKELGIDAKGVISSQDDTAAINLAARSIVSIWAYRDENQTGGSAGSGVIMELDKSLGNAKIITNFHVVYDKYSETGISQNIYINLYGEEVPTAKIKASYIGGTEYYDLAVIEVKNSDRIKASHAEVCSLETEPVIVGNTAIAIGNSQGKNISVNQGIISKIREDIPIVTPSGKRIKAMQVMRIDAQVNSGNSGGGLFNNKGHLIGIINAKSIEAGVDGVNYAIPLTVVKAVYQNIVDNCNGETTSINMAKLGVTILLKDQVLKEITLSDGNTYYVPSETVEITGVLDGLLGQKVGFLPGDILVKATINDKVYELDDFHSMTPMLIDVRVGDTIKFTVKRRLTENDPYKEVNCEATITQGDLVDVDQEKFTFQ